MTATGTTWRASLVSDQRGPVLTRRAETRAGLFEQAQVLLDQAEESAVCQARCGQAPVTLWRAKAVVMQQYLRGTASVAPRHPEVPKGRLVLGPYDGMDCHVQSGRLRTRRWGPRLDRRSGSGRSP